MARPDTGGLSLLLTTSRSAVRCLFDCVTANEPALRVLPLPLGAIPSSERVPAGGVLAVVDMAPDIGAALAHCARLRQRFPWLPVLVQLCCPTCVTEDQFESILAIGVGSILDWQCSPTQVLAAVRSAVQGERVLHCRVLSVRQAVAPGEGALGATYPNGDRTLLELVARGLSNPAIGKALGLSPHTVHHRLTAIMDRTGVQNRCELAAWAGRHGYYVSPADGARQPTGRDSREARRRIGPGGPVEAQPGLPLRGERPGWAFPLPTSGIRLLPGRSDG